ncbi:MAG: energy transducer TonB [Alistipes sp.]|nr:energy transducer TonB [Alistipes sp.]
MGIKKFVWGLLCGLGISLSAHAQEPLYLVNQQAMTASEFHAINPGLIERIKTLPADEESIARYGERAGNGVVIVTLKYDTEARFPETEGEDFAAYITRRVAWQESDPTARVSIRFTLTAEGRPTAIEVLEATDKRLLRRTLKAIEESPRWEPARKMGQAVASEQLLNLTLPTGRTLPRERYIILR